MKTTTQTILTLIGDTTLRENVKNLLKTISSKGQPLDYEETNIAEITTKFQNISGFIESERGQNIIDTLPKQKRD